MTNTQKRQRIERAKAREQMAASERKRRIAYAQKKEELEKRYGIRRPFDVEDMAFEDDRIAEHYQEEEKNWKNFSEKHVSDDERVYDEYYVDKKGAWLAILIRQLEIHSRMRYNKDASDIGEKYPPQDLDIDNEKSILLYEQYDRQISDMRRKMLTAYPPYFERPDRGQVFYKTKDGKTLVTPKAIIETDKVSARRLCFLVQTCLKDGALNKQSIHYLQAIDSGKKAPEFKGKIDTRDLRLYSTMFDSLKLARIIGGQDKGIAKRIESVGAKFLTAEDFKILQKNKPHFDAQQIVMMKQKFAENSL